DNRFGTVVFDRRLTVDPAAVRKTKHVPVGFSIDPDRDLVAHSFLHEPWQKAVFELCLSLVVAVERTWRTAHELPAPKIRFPVVEGNLGKLEDTLVLGVLERPSPKLHGQLLHRSGPVRAINPEDDARFVKRVPPERCPEHLKNMTKLP